MQFLKKIVFFSFFFLICIYSLHGRHYPYQLAVCAIFKDNAPYLKEWIEFHRHLGVDHFYLFDNASQDHPEKVLDSYIKKGIVTLIPWPNRNEEKWGKEKMAWVRTTQLPAYAHGRQLALNKAKWLAFIDTDEFLVPLEAATLTEFLAAYGNAPGVCLHWVVYGTSGVYEIPQNRLMIEMLVKRSLLDDPINHHTKSIIRPAYFNGWRWPPHACRYKRGKEAALIPMEEARINHYINRTIKYFYDHKVTHKETMDNSKWTEAYTDKFLSMGNEIEDHTMERFIPYLRKKLRLD